MKTIICGIALTGLLFAQCDWNEDDILDVLDLVGMVQYILDDVGELICNTGFDGVFDISDVIIAVECIVTDICVEQVPTAGWVSVPAGVFTYGQFDEEMVIQYDYQIMKYEVTHQQYVDYLTEALESGELYQYNDSTVMGYYPGDTEVDPGYYEYIDLDDAECRISWDGSEFQTEPGWENTPVGDVTWIGAWAMGVHYGAYLPTNYEWEKAARGITGWDFPWGDEDPVCEMDVCNGANFAPGWTPCYGSPTPVGSFSCETAPFSGGSSPYGAYDMAGNVWEFTSSFAWDMDEYAIRGGSWVDPAGNCCTWVMAIMDPENSGANIGFRFVQDVVRRD